MKVTITRYNDDGTETLGRLIIMSDNNTVLYTCFTLERPYLNNQHDISAIPAGSYPCVWAFQEDLNEYHYNITDVPNRSGIFIHEANTVAQIAGCVALGVSQGHLGSETETDVLNSRTAIHQFETLLNKQPFQLTILFQAPTA